MPRYDFRCSFCGPFERVLSVSEVTDRVPCPDCGETATRVFGLPTLTSRTSPVRRALAAERTARGGAADLRRGSATPPG